MTDLSRICPTCGKQRPPSSFTERWPDCFRCRALSVSVSPSSMPTRTGAALFHAKREEQRLQVDGDAYIRLRKDGYQPKAINGSAALERDATTRYEIESGNVAKNKPQLKEALSFFTDTFGRDVTTPVTTPTTSGDDAA